VGAINVRTCPSRSCTHRKYGATHTINATETKDVVQAIKDLTEGGLGADKAIECTGVVPVLQQAYDAVSTGGAIIQVGIPHYTKEWTFNSAVDSSLELVCGSETCAVLANVRFQKSIIGCVEGDCTPELLVPILLKQHLAGRCARLRICFLTS
jgi:aryl-alcohol dehydrogenase